MAKRDTGTKRTIGTTTTSPPPPPEGDTVEQRLLAFAEQLGRMVGTIQAKADGWIDRESLNKQIADVRDSASHLLDQFANAAAMAKASKKTPAAVPARGLNKGRSGGVVDAPGKKHRKQAPRDPAATRADSQAAKVRMARTMVKTSRRRGRG
jgi:hypothetical protein